MHKCCPNGLFRHSELFCQFCTARDQLSGMDGDALPLLSLPVGRKQQVDEQPGSVGLRIPFPVGQAARDGNEAARRVNAHGLTSFQVECPYRQIAQRQRLEGEVVTVINDGKAIRIVRFCVGDSDRLTVG